MSSEFTLAHIRNVRIVCASALVAGFFMPWVSIWGMGIAGYKIPKMAQGFRGFGMQDDPRVILALVPYLIPIMAFATIVRTLSEPPTKAADILGLVTGSLPFLFLFYGLTQIGGDLFRVLSIGGYWSLLSGAALAVVSLEFDTILKWQQDIARTQDNQPFQDEPASKLNPYEVILNYECPACRSSQKSNATACGDCGEPNPNQSRNDHSRIVLSQAEITRIEAAEEPSRGKRNFCAQCGERILHTDRFCSQCGAECYG